MESESSSENFYIRHCNRGGQDGQMVDVDDWLKWKKFIAQVLSNTTELYTGFPEFHQGSKLLVWLTAEFGKGRSRPHTVTLADFDSEI